MTTPPATFAKRLAAVYAFYRQDFNQLVLSVWWEALKTYDEAAVADALSRHTVDPDKGHFCPKPADVVRLISGGKLDSSMLAWSKAERAIRSVGRYSSVVFDDPIIHAVVTDMGGWIKLCGITEDELPFRAKEFENRYAGYRTRGRMESYPRHLIGEAEGHNAAGGYRIDPPLMVGDPEACQRVFQGGGDKRALEFKPLPVAQVIRELANG